MFLVTATLLATASWSATPPPKIDTVERSATTSPADAAVIIGNERYGYLAEVPFAERDADAVLQTMLLRRGIDMDRIVHLKGVNRDQIVDGVERASEQVGDDGVLWIYFAGHGAASPSTGELMLVGDDAKQDPTVFQARSVPVSELHEVAGVDTVFILDTCYAGVGRTGEQLIEGTRFAVPAYSSVASEDGPSLTMWTAAGPDEISGPYGPAKHGLFTYFAMGALRGWADGSLDDETDGQVTLEEAQQYVSKAFKALQVSNQMPELHGEASSLVVLGDKKLEQGPKLASLVRPEPIRSIDDRRESQIPQIAREFTWPVTRTGRVRYEDAYNAELRFRRHVVKIARYDLDGRRARRRFRLNLPLQMLTTFTTAALGYSTYVVAWDISTGHNLPRAAAWGGLVAGAGATVGMGALELTLVKKRRGQREALLGATNRVIQGEAWGG